MPYFSRPSSLMREVVSTKLVTKIIEDLGSTHKGGASEEIMPTTRQKSEMPLVARAIIDAYLLQCPLSILQNGR